MTIGGRIKDIRIQRGWSQRELAKRMGYSNHSTIGKIESGKVDIPQSRIVQFADVLGVTVAYLMNWEEVKKKNDDLTDIVLRLRSDEEFADVMKGISQLNQIQLASVKQVVEAFLSE